MPSPREGCGKLTSWAYSPRDIVSIESGLWQFATTHNLTGSYTESDLLSLVASTAGVLEFIDDHIILPRDTQRAHNGMYIGDDPKKQITVHIE